MSEGQQEVASEVRGAVVDFLVETVTNPLGAEDAEAPGPPFSIGATPTTPTLPIMPPPVIVEEDGVLIKHNFGADDAVSGAPKEHGPAHAHCEGAGPDTRIGPKGHVLRGDPEPSRAQRQVIKKYGKKIRKVLNKIGRILKGRGP